jgi:hypothetical protein
MASRFWVGGSGTWDNSSTANWSATTGGASGASAPTNADTVTFDANSGTAATVTVASTAVSLSTTLNKADTNLSLSGNATLCTAAGTLTFTTGTITLNNNVLTIGNIASNNSNTRAISFGTGSISLTGNAGAVINFNTATGFTYTGTPTVNLTYSGSTGTRSLFFGSSGGSQTNALSINVTAGSDIVQNTGVFYVNNFIFTGFTGTYTNTNNVLIYGNLTFVSGMTLSASASGWTLNSASGTQLITTNTKTLDFPISFNGANTTFRLQDNMTVGLTRLTSVTIGTLDLNGNTLSTGRFDASNSNVRVIAFGSGNITTTGSGTVWNTGTVTNFSYTGTPTVNISNNSATATTVTTGAMSAAQALNFNYTVGTYTLTDTSAVYKSLNFTGFTGTIPNSVRTIYGSLTLVSGMTLTAGANTTTFAATSGTQTITTAAKTLDFPLTFNGVGGTFAFQDALTQGSTRAFTISAGTVQLKASATSTVGSFVANSGTMKYLQSTLAGTQATISQASGTVSASNLTIKDINATGGAVWNAYYINGDINAGNNTGWDFLVQLGRYIYTRRKNKVILN